MSFSNHSTPSDLSAMLRQVHEMLPLNEEQKSALNMALMMNEDEEKEVKGMPSVFPSSGPLKLANFSVFGSLLLDFDALPPSASPSQVMQLLMASRQQWQDEKVKTVWVKTWRASRADKFLSVLYGLGFVPWGLDRSSIHQMVYWRLTDKDSTPAASTTEAGVAVVVVTPSASHAVMVKERYRKGWKLAGGGVEHGQLLTQCARDEIKQEVGIDLDASSLRMVAHNDEPHAGRGLCRRDFYTFFGHLVPGGPSASGEELPELKLQQEEIDEGKVVACDKFVKSKWWVEESQKRPALTEAIARHCLRLALESKDSTAKFSRRVWSGIVGKVPVPAEGDQVLVSKEDFTTSPPTVKHTRIFVPALVTASRPSASEVRMPASMEAHSIV